MSSLVKFPEPIRIVGYNPDLKKYQFDAKAFAKIATSDEIKDLPIAVVSIIGDNRKGKSFLLNYFLRYLQRYDQEDWLGDPNEPLQGFPWKQGTEKVTVGMVLWPEPLVITKKDGTKIAVLLMDTQGLFDHQSKDENYMDIFVISSLLSSVQVYNKSNNIQSNDIIQLSQLIKYLKEKQKNVLDFEQAVLLEKPEKLWFLVRDWAFECDHSFGAVGGRQFLNFKKSNQSNKFKQAWDTIDECYSEVDCFLMPHPGLDAINNPDFQGERCNLEPDFVDSLRELVLNLLSPENIAIKKTEDKPMKFLEFLKLVEIFGTTFSGKK
uniref:GB1/RHD3-type G domain-containing protein n=1 Tax=Tetranychus urticae TaxID=32264 RepID=T1JZM6_TETUR